MSNFTAYYGNQMPSNYMGEFKVSPDICFILGAVATLERDILVERVKNGLANAKAKGIKIGRKKTRDSVLIRKLFDAGSTYREMANICKCSSGAVGAEIKVYKMELKEKNELEKALKEREYESIKDELHRSKAKVASLEEKFPFPPSRITTPQKQEETKTKLPDLANPIEIII